MKTLFVSVSRSDFGILENLIKKTKLDPEFDVKLLITGEHNSKKLNFSKNEAIKKFKNIIEVFSIKNSYNENA